MPPRRRQVPALVSRTRAAELLGIGANNLHRYEDRLKPYEVPIEGARAPAYLKAGIAALELEMRNGDRP